MSAQVLNLSILTCNNSGKGLEFEYLQVREPHESGMADRETAARFIISSWMTVEEVTAAWGQWV